MKAFLLNCLLGSILFFTGCVWHNPEENSEFLPLNDKDYPYSQIPRIVIETQNFRDIRNTEDLIPAQIQVYGKDSPSSEVKNVFIRGRGNSSFSAMAQYSLKLEFADKESLLGMAPNKDWALISNYADRTLLKNLITYKLSTWLNSDYTPSCRFVEIFLNRQYMGAYLLAETIKVGKNRVDIPKDDKSYLLEFDKKYKDDEQVVFPKEGNPIRVHYPKNLDTYHIEKLTDHMDSVNHFVKNFNYDEFEKWFKKDAYLLNYWVQEFSKNTDAAFKTSVFFSWIEGQPISMGPLWDFDLAYGGWNAQKSTDGWYIRYSGWNKNLFNNSEFKKDVKDYWKKHRSQFEKLNDTLHHYSQELQETARNHFKRWPVLDTDENWGNTESYRSYDEAVDSLQSWIQKRILWIDNH